MTRRLRPLLLLTALSAAAQSPPFRDPFTAGSATGPAMIAVPAIETEIGAPPDDPQSTDNELLHRVVLSPYAIAIHEVTTADFCRFLNEEGNVRDYYRIEAVDLAVTPIRKTAAGFVPAEGTANSPVVGVTWRGARAYCRWLSRRTRRRYDLPTAAQWEVAARAGSRDPWHWGGDEDATRYRSAAGQQKGTSDVGSYPPNAWGMHDTAGNVWEWMLDCFESDFAIYAPLRDPVIRNDACEAPEIRGGSFRDGGYLTRAAFRSSLPWSARLDNVGFRVARALEAGEQR